MQNAQALHDRVARINAECPSVHFADSEFVNPRTAAVTGVGQVPQPLSDEARENAIVRAGNAMQSEYAAYQAADARGDLPAATEHLNRAYRHLEQQRLLIAGRSREQIARMEAEKGLS